jgi:hypothetical protein
VIRFSKLCTGLLALALLAGCTALKEVPPAKKHEIGGVFRVEPGSAWSAQKTGRGEIWTVNGFGLERMAFITNVADGKPLLTHTQDEDAPTFRADMNATDVVNLYEALLTSNGYSQIQVSNLRPHTISGQDAFRFDYTAFSRTGLAKQGMVVGLIDPDKGLNLAVYEAASEHYFEASRAAAEGVLASLEKI